MRSSHFLCAILIGLVGCGPSKDTKPPEAKTGPIQRLFLDVSQKHKIPYRLLLASALLESGLSTQGMSTIYQHPDRVEGELRQIKMGQTVFGLPLTRLGLEGDPRVVGLDKQVAAYGEALARHLERNGLKLPAQPQTADDKGRWIWEIAQFHRDGLHQRRSVQIIFALEMIQLLNKGMFWQDAKGEEKIQLSAENPPLKVDGLGKEQQAALTLTSEGGEFFPSTYLRLTRPRPTDRQNQPKRVEVIHCPLTLSACLEMQQSDQEDVRLGAHYVIPPSFKSTGTAPSTDGVVSHVLQVALHNEVVTLTTRTGEQRLVDDAIVIMLAGHSGRVQEGIRLPANPRWLTGPQLERLGDIVDDICHKLADKNGVNYETCRKPGVNGVQFHRQGASEVYRWGDIPDFDESIFESYLGELRPSNGVAFDEPASPKRLAAGQEVPLTLSFEPTARVIEFEQLVRCPDARLIWMPLTTEQTRSESKMTIRKRFFDSGPNGNGQHFIRAKVSGKDEELIGWRVTEFFVNGFDASPPAHSQKYCLRNGT